MRTDGAYHAAPKAQTRSGFWGDYQRLLVNPMAPALCFVHPASARGTSPRLMSLDLVDYGLRKCVNAALTGLVVALTAPVTVAIGLPIEAARCAHGPLRMVFVPFALPFGLAVGCVSGVTNFGLRGMGACFGAAAALMGAACFPMDLTGSALEQLAASVG